jgi:hypothetical protein
MYNVLGAESCSGGDTQQPAAAAVAAAAAAEAASQAASRQPIKKPHQSKPCILLQQVFYIQW